MNTAKLTKNPTLLTALLSALAIIGYSAYRLTFSEPEEPSRFANELPPIEFENLDGVPTPLTAWAGRPLLVNFWATWCAPCRREIPLLKATQAAQAESRLQVIGIAVDYPDEVVAYAESAEFNYPILIGQQDAIAAAESSGIEFVGMPFTLVVSADGRLIKAHLGEIVAEHIDRISAVAIALESGELDVDAAKEALLDL